MIESAQINYISTAGTIGKKGFGAYKRFISSMESKKHTVENEQNQTTVWDNIEKYEKRRNKN
jgi:hypothetical protein